MPVEEHGLKDSGLREMMPTGMVREPRIMRGRYDLISPIALRRLAIHYERGAMKYADRNWEKGGPFSRFLSSAKSHLDDYLEGDRKEDHLSAAVWNIFCIIHLEQAIERGLVPAELNDLPSYIPKEDQAGSMSALAPSKLSAEPVPSSSSLKPGQVVIGGKK